MTTNIIHKDNIKIRLKSSVYIVFFILICCGLAYGQVPEQESGEEISEEMSLEDVENDEEVEESDELQADEPAIQDTLRVKIGPDPVDREIVYSARDSSDLNRKENKLYLWGEAKIEYESYIIEADEIVLEMDNNLAIARSKDGEQYVGQVKFNDGGEEMLAKFLKYNFKTKKGYMEVARMQQGDLNIISEKMKFISEEEDEYKDDAGFGQSAIFTTCNAPTPHFGVRSYKQKIVPDKVVVVGASNVEIGQVPTPLVLPFGFFPITKGAQKGIIFPNDYEYSEQWGFGLRGIGYYIPISEKMDLTVLADIYLRGSWGLQVDSRYNFKYKATGSYNLMYARRLSENLQTGEQDVVTTTSIRWTHNQDPKAHPYQTFTGSVNFQTNNHQSVNFNDAQSVLQNSITSNVSYRRTFAGKPYNLSASLQHSQNTQTNQVNITFPQLDFQMQRIFPFEKKNRGGNKPKWYEEISLTYNGRMSNRFRTTDSTIWTRQTLDDARFGIQHRAAVNSNFRLFKYISVVPNVDVTEVWQFSSVNKFFDEDFAISDTIINVNPIDTIINVDTVGQIITERVNGFRAWRQYNVGASMNTQLFGTMQFKKGFIRGLRHVIKPTVSMNFSPDYQNPNLDYIRAVRRDLLSMDSVFYSVFEDNIFGAPPQTGRQLSLNYSIMNIFEGKYWSRKDSMDRKFKMFDNVLITGNYNFAADSLKFSQINFSGTHRILKGMTVIQMRMVLDPYERDYSRSIQGTRINKFAWNESGRLLNFVNATTTINSNLRMQTVRSWFEPDRTETEEDDKERVDRLGPQSLWDWFQDFSINHTLMMGVTRTANGSEFMIGTNNIQVVGSIVLTDNWRITLGSIGYDFNQRQMTYPDVGFQRDLHCWEMGMNWQPLRGTYNFYISVKPGSLDFLKVPYRKNNEDGLRRL